MPSRSHLNLHKKLVTLRQSAGSTPAELAEKLFISTSNTSRLEIPGSTISPELSAIADCAMAAGVELEIEFMAQGTMRHNESVQRAAPTRIRCNSR